MTENLTILVNGLWNNILNYFPNLLGAGLLLLVGVIFAWLGKTITQRLAQRFGLDRLFNQIAMSNELDKSKITKLPSEIIGILIYWIILLNFIIAAFEQLQLVAALPAMQALILYLPNIGTALFIIIAGAVLAQFLGRATETATATIGLEYHKTLGQIVQSLLLIIIVIIAIQQLGIDTFIFASLLTNLITIFAVGIMLTFAIGGRDIAKNILAGYYVKESYQLGEEISIGEISGTVESITTLNSEIHTSAGIVLVPNSTLTDEIVKKKK